MRCALWKTLATASLGQSFGRRTTSAVTSNVTGVRTSAHPLGYANRIARPCPHGCTQVCTLTLYFPALSMAASGVGRFSCEFDLFIPWRENIEEYIAGFKAYWRFFSLLESNDLRAEAAESASRGDREGRNQLRVSACGFPQQKSGGLLRRFSERLPNALTAQSDADRSIGSVEIAIIALGGFDTAVHCPKEKVGAVTETDFGGIILK